MWWVYDVQFPTMPSLGIMASKFSHVEFLAAFAIVEFLYYSFGENFFAAPKPHLFIICPLHLIYHS